MEKNMRQWLDDVRESKRKKAMPILSFPGAQLLGVTVRELIADVDLQVRGMKAVAERSDSLAAVGFMDLSVEAETFGAAVKTFDHEVPTVVDALLASEEDADALAVPDVSQGRTRSYVECMQKVSRQITDRPVFAGIIGPFSLAGRLVDVNRALVYCKKNPVFLHKVLRKATDFLLQYGRSFQAAGADGVVVAEPLAGLLSPKLAAEFSEPYVREIAQGLRKRDFLVIYHNCGNSASKMTESILRTGCDAYHFGNAVNMKGVLEMFPEDTIVMGNIDPVGQFNQGTPASIRKASLDLLQACAPSHRNFILSSGCDIPPSAKWENIDAFFQAVRDYYETETLRA